MSELAAAQEALLQELVRQDKALYEANQDLRLAQMKWTVESAKYQAVRDLTLDRLPYGIYDWAVKRGYEFVTRGEYRFMGMTPGQAVIAALREAREPVPLPKILLTLNRGGAHMVPRTITAALMQTKGVVKTDDDSYYVDEDELLPFEN